MIPAEKIQSNWSLFLKNIDTYITGDRKDQLLSFYKQTENQIVLTPASSKESYHNCFPGGYVDHVNRVVEYAIDFYQLWFSKSEHIDFTLEELVFAAINHDLGKIGFVGVDNYIENESEWHRKNQGALYKNNPALPFASIPDRSLFLLQQAGIVVSWNETLGIKLHDGLYEDSNKQYLISYSPESRLRTSLPLILHQADLTASRIEWENQWIEKLNGEKKVEDKKKTINKPQATSEAMARVSAKNPGLMAALKNI